MLTIKEELAERAKKFEGKDDIFSILLLTNPGYISSSRSLMFSSHSKQWRTLNEPECPRVFTNYENIVGENSTGYYKADTEYEIISKIPRFTDDIDESHLYTLIIYDKKKNRYDLINKPLVEDLTEKFGFKYITDNIDSKEEGDIIEKDEILYHSTSYDEDGNYRYGVNAKVMYSTELFTIEDAIIIRKGFKEKMKATDVDTISISLNDNDILVNLFGTSSEYKPFPDINEKVSHGIVCAKRRIHNSQILYDLKKSNLNKINPSTDTCYYYDGKVEDIFIYSNKDIEDIPDVPQYQQIKKYMIMQEEYYSRLYEECKKIIDSGAKYSKDLAFYYKKAKDALDKNTKWVDNNNSEFSNIIMEITLSSISTTSKGQKMTGRQGNKGVVSIVWDDDMMPYDENGNVVDVIVNSLGVLNRLNTLQIIEQNINFITNAIADKIKTLDNNTERFDMVYDIVNRFSVPQAKKMKKYYNDLDDLEKDQYFEDIYKYGIFIHMKPLWEEKPVFDIIWEIFDDYPWIEIPDLYVNRFGRTIPILRKVMVGELYMVKMKQTSKTQFSARSMGAINRKGTPDNSSLKNSDHQELYSTTAQRIGYQENDMHLIGLDPKEINKFHKAYRSSLVDRQQLGMDLINNIVVDDFKETNSPNRNVEILQAYLKAMGLRFVYLGETEKINISDGSITARNTDEKYFIGTDEEYEDYVLLQKAIDHMRYDGVFIGSREEYDEKIKELVEKERKRKNRMIIDI
jgi:DNA-directed RNA polymerase beta subunit